MNEVIKILVFSDSHGKFNFMNTAALKERPEIIFHLGDGIFDMYRLQAEFTGIAVTGVKGNCDAGSNEPTTRSLTFDGVKIFMAHGHLYGVKSGYDTAIDVAKNVSADILLFGHTHHPIYEMSGSLHILNPGSVFDGSYGLIEIKDGKPFCRLKSLV